MKKEVYQETAIRNQSFEIAAEAQIIYPNLKKFSLGRSFFTNLEKAEVDTLLTAYVSFRPKANPREVGRFRTWLQQRTKADTIALILD